MKCLGRQRHQLLAAQVCQARQLAAVDLYLKQLGLDLPQQLLVVYISQQTIMEI